MFSLIKKSHRCDINKLLLFLVTSLQAQNERVGTGQKILEKVNKIRLVPTLISKLPGLSPEFSAKTGTGREPF